MNFSAVVGYHMNPLTCGVAKFNAELAKRLGVPFTNRDNEWGRNPLLSLKWSELDTGACMFLHDAVDHGRPFSVFWHDEGSANLTARAEHVFYADPSLGSPGLWCPSLIPARKRPIRLFSFGMAHKLQTERYKRVRELLDAAKQPYHLRVSVGLHEGTSLDGAEKHFDALKEIMGPEHVTILGILSDDAVSEELANAEYVLAFFEQGLRSNNTTVHAALDYGRQVITNHDDDTPTFIRGMTRNVDSDWLMRRFDYSWNNLIFQMESVCAASPSTVTR